jgi:hypothetical protein
MEKYAALTQDEAVAIEDSAQIGGASRLNKKKKGKGKLMGAVNLDKLPTSGNINLLYK